MLHQDLSFLWMCTLGLSLRKIGQMCSVTPKQNSKQQKSHVCGLIMMRCSTTLWTLYIAILYEPFPKSLAIHSHIFVVPPHMRALYTQSPFHSIWWRICPHAKYVGVYRAVVFAALLHVSVDLGITCKWWMLKCWQGEDCPSGFDPAPYPWSSSPSVRSRTTLSWVSLPATWCRPTWLASPSCPMTVASKETCLPVLIPPHCHPWKLPAWVPHGNNSKGKSNACYFCIN